MGDHRFVFLWALLALVAVSQLLLHFSPSFFSSSFSSSAPSSSSSSLPPPSSSAAVSHNAESDKQEENSSLRDELARLRAAHAQLRQRQDACEEREKTRRKENDLSDSSRAARAAGKNSTSGAGGEAEGEVEEGDGDATMMTDFADEVGSPACTLAEFTRGRWVQWRHSSAAAAAAAQAAEAAENAQTTSRSSGNASSSPAPPPVAVDDRAGSRLVFEPACPLERPKRGRDMSCVRGMHSLASSTRAKSHVKVVWMGDSHAIHYFGALQGHVSRAGKDGARCTTIKSGSKCKEQKEYFGLEPHDTLPEQCKGCGGCVSRLVECLGRDETRPWKATLEAVVNSKLDDQFMPSKGANTTQDSILEYFRRDPPDFVIFNSGAHYVESNETHLDYLYRSRLIYLFQRARMLLPSTQVIWLHTTRRVVRGNGDGDTKNPADGFRQKWLDAHFSYANALAYVSARQNQVPVIDAFNISFGRPDAATDGLHYYGDGGAVYNLITGMAIDWVCHHIVEGSAKPPARRPKGQQPPTVANAERPVEVHYDLPALREKTRLARLNKDEMLEKLGSTEGTEEFRKRELIKKQEAQRAAAAAAAKKKKGQTEQVPAAKNSTGSAGPANATPDAPADAFAESRRRAGLAKTAPEESDTPAVAAEVDLGSKAR